MKISTLSPNPVRVSWTLFRNNITGVKAHPMGSWTALVKSLKQYFLSIVTSFRFYLQWCLCTVGALYRWILVYIIKTTGTFVTFIMIVSYISLVASFNINMRVRVCSCTINILSVCVSVAGVWYRPRGWYRSSRRALGSMCKTGTSAIRLTGTNIQCISSHLIHFTILEVFLRVRIKTF